MGHKHGGAMGSTDSMNIERSRTMIDETNWVYGTVREAFCLSEPTAAPFNQEDINSPLMAFQGALSVF